MAKRRSISRDHGAESSGVITSSQLIVSGRVELSAVIIHTDGSNNATVTVYDNTSATGKIIARFTVHGPDEYGGRDFNRAVWCDNGIYVVISGTGASAIVEWIEGLVP